MPFRYLSSAPQPIALRFSRTMTISFPAPGWVEQDAEEIWSLYQSSQLKPDSVLTGRFERSEATVDLESVMREINDTLKDEERRKLFSAQ